jgi:hypothetical protein
MRTTFCNLVTRLVTGSGVALLVFSLMLAPTSVNADDGDPDPGAFCTFCSENNCQAVHGPPNCGSGTCTGTFCPSACTCKKQSEHYCYCN